MSEIHKLLLTHGCSNRELMEITNKILDDIKSENTLPVLLSLAIVLKSALVSIEGDGWSGALGIVMKLVDEYDIKFVDGQGKEGEVNG